MAGKCFKDRGKGWPYASNPVLFLPILTRMSFSQLIFIGPSRLKHLLSGERGQREDIPKEISRLSFGFSISQTGGPHDEVFNQFCLTSSRHGERIYTSKNSYKATTLKLSRQTNL